ncbi:hypothetical protein COCON_G00146540 [Conger conger]|uniref:Tetraspanin n=1 Tax=Conger conger TaxID=82655 RepID=A0A9Q1DBV9_CONCO|nr:CD63 antigen [Conger conger]KAJ8265555.1 hypothetical protein COCON_G00146540 [Conger conger]
MAVAGGLKCVKFLLFFFNFLFWLCGITLIVVGVLVQVALHNTAVMKNASSSVAPLVVIGVGVVIFFVSFFGCCGAWKESYCMVTTFAILVSIIIIIEIAAAIGGYIFWGKLSGIVNDELKDMISKYKNGTRDFRKSIDNLQKCLNCCGMNSTADWKYLRKDKTSVPDSCCKNITQGCGNGNMHNDVVVYQKGCRIALEAFLRKNVLWVVIAALVIAFLQIMGVVFACLLMKGIRSGYEVM